jgi:hypothetical protein
MLRRPAISISCDKRSLMVVVSSRSTKARRPLSLTLVITRSAIVVRRRRFPYRSTESRSRWSSFRMGAKLHGFQAMTDLRAERAVVEEIEREVRTALDTAMDGAARISEFTVDTAPLEARRPLTTEQREVAVALNTLSDVLGRRASEACAARESSWLGLSDAANIVSNETGRLGLPQLFRHLDEHEGKGEEE